MASKQLGKFKQWAGEKISSRDKTVVVDDLKELEQDIELRKQGILRLQAAAEDYYHVLSKKKESPASGETEKLMSLDALGIVMVTHGEEFGDDSAFGTSLVKLGRAQCKIAMLQEAYALTFQDTFVSSCAQFAQDIKDYEYQRKKLESRRLSYDAAISKLDKIKTNKKEKEKERREAEDELQRCRLRFEETSEDVRSRIQAIQENEIQQLRELTTFLDIQVNFSKQSFDVLQDVKASWCDESTLSKFEHVRTKSRTHVSLRSVDNNVSPALRQRRSNLSNRSTTLPSSNTSEEDEVIRIPSRRKSDAESKPMSRPTSRASRKRSDSHGATGAPAEGAKSGKKMSVTGWASNAVSSIAGRGKKDKDIFSALMNDDEEKGGILDVSRPPSSRSFSRKSPKVKAQDLEDGSSPRAVGRIFIPPSLQEKKVVRALHDFNGSSDDLTFKAGDEIVVLNEVLDDWWLGMLKDGQKGLFPRGYTELITKDEISHRTPTKVNNLSDSLGSNYPQTFHDDSDDDESIDHYLPMDVPHSATGYGFDMPSVTTHTAEDEENHLIPAKQDDLFQDPKSSPIILPPSFTNKRTGCEEVPVKKPPPPVPPPRRLTNSRLPPVVPDRPSSKHSSSAFVSASAPTSVYLASPSVPSGQGQDLSPFDSLMDVSLQCSDFKQHPYERSGLCSNCFRMH